MQFHHETKIVMIFFQKNDIKLEPRRWRGNLYGYRQENAPNLTPLQLHLNCIFSGYLVELLVGPQYGDLLLEICTAQRYNSRKVNLPTRSSNFEKQKWP